MCRVVAALVEKNPDMQVAFGIDKNYNGEAAGFPVYRSTAEVPEEATGDVIIDFSHFTAVPDILDFAYNKALPIVVCTTALEPGAKEKMKSFSEKIPVFFSANMSLGICVLKKLARQAAEALGDDFDIEIVERHHNRKIDAPSGTALAIADAINEGLEGRFDYIYDRHERHEKRSKNEIGIASVRGGNIVGDHEVIYAGPNEVIEITHRAQSRDVFADGAIKAAGFLKGKPAGMYSMEDIIG